LRLLIVIFSVTLFAAPQDHPAATKKSTPKRHHTSKSAKKPAAAATSHRSTQQTPTTDRFREIQQALMSKGYFNGPADGNWGAASVDALKRFQREQNLTEDGKIGSLSLIALGLGPQRTAPAEPALEKVVQQ
jgi:peptidoglycan hydrolase-like protein with peptidoglycan-binding domain